MTALVGCALVPIGVGSSGGLYPTGCSSLGFGLWQCAAIVDLALGDTTRLPAGTAVLIRPPVHVFVVFDVTEITGRAVLGIRNLVVG